MPLFHTSCTRDNSEEAEWYRISPGLPEYVCVVAYFNSAVVWIVSSVVFLAFRDYS